MGEIARRRTAEDGVACLWAQYSLVLLAQAQLFPQTQMLPLFIFVKRAPVLLNLALQGLANCFFCKVKLLQQALTSTWCSSICGCGRPRCCAYSWNNSMSFLKSCRQAFVHTSGF